VYALNFDLTGLDPAAASLSGRMLADDVQVCLNGNFTGVPFSTAYLDRHDFNASSEFAADLNTLELRLQNSGAGPTGLAVSALTGATQAVPGPGSPSLAAAGLGTPGMLSRRRRKQGDTTS
jgi:hypothetical protein